MLALKGGEVLVEDENGFADWYPMGDLISRGPLPIGEVRPKDEPVERPVSRSRTSVNKKVVDLHFDQLVDYPKNFTSYEKLEIQLTETRKSIDQCKKAGIKKLILIHGVGEGKLKEAVHSMLERLDGLRFYDASLAEYGRGATEVEFY